jgi:hypothetical protein
VAGRLTLVSEWLGIVELGQVCSRLRSRNVDLFHQLGAWVATTSDGELQRLFADACHRHAWHAELWADRTPTIPVAPVDPVADAAEARRPAADTADPADAARRREYHDSIAEIAHGLAALRRRIDATLDPSTARTLDLIDVDLSDLRRRLAG